MLNKMLYSLVILGFVFIIGCESQATKVDIKESANNEETDLEFAEAMYRMDAFLLSSKHKIDEEKIFNLLNEDDFGLMIHIPEGKESKERIVNYANKHAIPLDKLASVLIDYISMTCEN